MWEKRLSAPHDSPPRQGRGERLAARRRSKRRRVHVAFGILLFLLCGGAVYGLRQDAVRISDIQVFGADELFAEVARAALRGSYLGIIPHDSIFFFPASRIRTNLMNANSDIAAVSIFRSGLTGLSIKVDTRVPIARWCGSAPLSSDFIENCYVFDAGGFIYATTSVAQPVNSFIVYEPLATLGENPIGSTLPNYEKLSLAFDFARQLVTFGSPVTSVVFRGDEVNDYLASGTRVTYVLGDEDNAFTAITSARANFDLSDGSILYLDLRFSGKIYLKRK